MKVSVLGSKVALRPSFQLIAAAKHATWPYRTALELRRVFSEFMMGNRLILLFQLLGRQFAIPIRIEFLKNLRPSGRLLNGLVGVFL
jgi:hypothetical protein